MTSPSRGKFRAVFFDRDGTLMRDVDYCGEPENVEVFEGAGEALRRLDQAGYKLVVITNQSGIGRGYFNEQQYQSVERELSRQLGEGLIAATYYCPHLPADKCRCRKPSADMVVRASRDLELDLARSFFVGDKRSDIECGRNAGVRTILVRTGYGTETDPALADFTVNNLGEAVQLILNEE